MKIWKVGLAIVIVALALGGCSGGEYRAADDAVVMPASNSRPVEVARTDMDRFREVARSHGLIFDGSEYCDNEFTDEGEWWIERSQAYAFCFATDGGRAAVYGGFVMVDGGKAEEFGELLYLMGREMGYPHGLFMDMVEKLDRMDWGGYSYGGLIYTVDVSPDLKSVQVSVVGTP